MSESTGTDLEPILLRRLAPWVEQANGLISDRLDDARAHAARAITERAKQAPDGKPTLQLVTQSRSFQAAVNRLDALHDSLVELTKDARAFFYRDSFRLWLPSIPVEIRISDDPKPTREGERQARGLVLYGTDLVTEIGAGIEDASRGLRAAVTMAASKAALPKEINAALDTWQRQKTDALKQRARTALSDSDVAVHQLVGRLMVHRRFHA